VDVKNQQHQQLRPSLNELVDPAELQNKINALNNQWKTVREGTEDNLNNLDECHQLLKVFEERFKKVKLSIDGWNENQV
jgi:peptidoglycan hydrolase CwlO-like protein